MLSLRRSLFSVFLIETVKYSRKCLVIASLPIWAQQSHMSHMVLQKRAMKELWDTCSSLSWDWLPLKKETGTHIPHGYSFQQLWWSCGLILQRSDRWATRCLWFVCEIEVGWQFQVSWHLQRLGTSKWKVLCWKVGTWRRWRQVIPVSRLRTIKYHLKVHLNNVGDLNDMECDDIASQSIHSIGDFWRVFVSYVSCVWLRSVCTLSNPWLCE